METTMEVDRKKDERNIWWEPDLYPRTDITEHEDRFEIVIEMPGVSQEAIDIQVEGDELRVSGTRARAAKPAEARYLVRERRQGTYRRSCQLGPKIDRGGIEAKMSDGVLRLRLPKAAAALPRRIDIG